MGRSPGTSVRSGAARRSRWKQRGPEIVAGVVVSTLVGFAVALPFGASPGTAALVCAALRLAAALFAVCGWRAARSHAAKAEAAASDARTTQMDERKRLE